MEQEENKPGMTVDQLYDHIVKHMTPEEALKKLLSTHVFQYEHLKVAHEFKGQIHPLFVMIQCAFEMGWNMLALDQSDEVVQGVIVGTSEYVDQWVKKDKE